MNHFERRAGVLHAEGVPLDRLAAEVGTPAYVYSTATLRRHLAVFQAAFPQAWVCYSVKASSTLGLLRLFARGGAGFDIVSGGELARVLKAGGKAERVVFSGLGKTDDELHQALQAGVALFNVESEEELLALDRVARALGRRAPFAIRVNPDVDARTHPYIATGLKTSKFGVSFDKAVALYRRSRGRPGLAPVGLDCHIGSQMTDVSPVREAVAKVAELFRALRAQGFGLTHLDVGGGMGVTYTDEAPVTVEAYAEAVREPLRGLGAQLILEPGRVLVANAGLLLTRVLYRKVTEARRYVVVDAGMNDLLRPALYQAVHGIVPVRRRRGAAPAVDVVGPVCESSDVLGVKRALGPVRPGDALAILTAGAYGMSMASNYNSRLRPAEVLVEGDAHRLIRRREQYSDLWRGETP